LPPEEAVVVQRHKTTVGPAIDQFLISDELGQRLLIFKSFRNVHDSEVFQHSRLRRFRIAFYITFEPRHVVHKLVECRQTI
jgi:hypothetical protein